MYRNTGIQHLDYAAQWLGYKSYHTWYISKWDQNREFSWHFKHTKSKRKRCKLRQKAWSSWGANLDRKLDQVQNSHLHLLTGCFIKISLQSSQQNAPRKMLKILQSSDKWHFAPRIEEESPWKQPVCKLASVIFVHKALHGALYHLWFQNKFESQNSYWWIMLHIWTQFKNITCTQLIIPVSRSISNTGYTTLSFTRPVWLCNLQWQKYINI